MVIIRILVKLRLKAAEIATKHGIPEALTILLRDFIKEPRKLSLDDMQTAIDFLSTHNKATIFLALSNQHRMEEHRDQWLKRQAGVNIFQV